MAQQLRDSMPHLAAVVLVAATAAVAMPAAAGAQSTPAGPTVAPPQDAPGTQVVDQAKRIALKGDDPGVTDMPWDLAVTPKAVWVLEPRAGEVQRVDPDTNKVAARIKLPAASCAPGTCGIDRIAADRRDVWLTNNAAGLLVHIDARTNKVVGQTDFRSGIHEPPVIDEDGAWINAGS